MTANVAAIDAATTRFIAIFESGLRRAPSTLAALAVKMPSTGQSNTYNWMPLGVTVREWKGSRHYNDAEVFPYTLSNKKWEATLEIPVDTFDDDRAAGLGLYDDQIRQMAMTVAHHPQKLLAQAMVAGLSTAGPDGVNFFSTAHITADGANNRSNRVSSDQALDAAAFEEALTLLYKMKMYNGDELNVVSQGKLVLTVPPSLRATAESILKAERLSSGASNTLYMRAELRIMPELESQSSTAWFLSVEGEGLPKPFIWQERMAPEFYAKDDPNTSDRVFDKDEVSYGSKARYNLGYHHCEVIVASAGTGG